MFLFIQETIKVNGQSKSDSIKMIHTCKECDENSKLSNNNYSGCHFKKSRYFEGTHFENFTCFDSTIFEDYANFEEIDAPKGISFSHVLFKDDFSLYRGGNFRNNFNSSIFRGEARFERFTFIDTVDFSNCTFEKMVSFKDVGFDMADFSHLHLTQKTEFAFQNTRVINKLDFSFNPNIYNEIRLIDAYDSDPTIYTYQTETLQKPCLINLYKSDISKFYLDYIHFKLFFPDYYDSTRNNITHITLYEKQIIYESLLSNFKIHDQFDSYKLLDIEYQKFKYDNAKHPIYKWLAYYWNNFGYNNEYIFRWTFGLLIFFSIINFFIIEGLNNRIYLIESIPIKLPPFKRMKGYKFISFNLKNISFRFWFSLVYTTAIFFKVTLKIENFKFEHKLGTFYLVIIYTSGLICLAYMANFILQK